MAGLSHSALRQIIFDFGGVGLLSTEMLSAKRLPTECARVSPYLIRIASEKPLSYQLLISTAREIAAAIDVLHKLKADAVDLNMGCPAPTVSKIGAGIRLMEQPENVRSIVAEARKRTTLPLTAKIRIGIELNDNKLKTFCTMLEDEGIDMIYGPRPAQKGILCQKVRAGTVLLKLRNGFISPLSPMVGYSRSKMRKIVCASPAPTVLCSDVGQRHNLGFLRK